MGEHWYDWFLPVKNSPCSRHGGGESLFEIGPVVDRMRKDAGIALPRGEGEKPHRRRRRKGEDRRDDHEADFGHSSHERDGMSREMPDFHRTGNPVRENV